MTDEPPAAAAEPPFEHRPVMRDEIVAVFGPVPPGVVFDATLGGGGHAEAILDDRPDLTVVGVDRDPEALAVGGRAPRPLRPPLHRRPRPLRRPRAGPPHPPDPGRRDQRGVVRPRRVVAAVRPGPARLLLPARRSPRHADGPHPGVLGDGRRQRLRRRRPRPRHPPLRRRTLRRPHRQGHRRRPTRRRDGRARRHREDGDPGGHPPPRRTSRPGARSRRSASRSTPSSSTSRPPSTPPSTPPCRVVGSQCSRTTRARTASSRTASAGPPASATARPICPACAAPASGCVWCGGSPGGRRTASCRTNPRAAAARLRVAERLGDTDTEVR